MCLAYKDRDLGPENFHYSFSSGIVTPLFSPFLPKGLGARDSARARWEGRKPYLVATKILPDNCRPPLVLLARELHTAQFRIKIYST